MLNSLRPLAEEAGVAFWFDKPEAAVMEGLSLTLRPPVETRAAYLARHAALIAEMG